MKRGHHFITTGKAMRFSLKTARALRFARALIRPLCDIREQL